MFDDALCGKADSAALRAFHAIALTKTGFLDAAFEEVTRALALDPQSAEGALARIEALEARGDYVRALEESRALYARAPSLAAQFLVGAGSFRLGAYEDGLRLIAAAATAAAPAALAKWDGAPAPDAHLLVICEQGFGDVLHFARYLDGAAKKVGRLTCVVPLPLARLMAANFPLVSFAVAVETAEGSSLPPGVMRGVPQDATLHCSLMELALFGEGGFAPCPVPVPYIRADEALRCVWRERLAEIPSPRIGVAWASPMTMNEPARAVTFDDLRPIFEVARGHMVSLQLGEEATRAQKEGLFDAAPFIHDFADSAALMAELDLIITIDSAPAHLAGALGRPCRVLLPANAEWRWQVGREDCLWYPSVALCRQNHPFDWLAPVEAVAQELKPQIPPAKEG